jgi:hypothetical protein
MPTPYRYKMTVELETPEGLRTGHAVRQVSFHPRPEGVYSARVTGEAVAVDLPDGQTLFALLADRGGNQNYAAWIAGWALKAALKPGGANADYEAGRFAELYPTQPRTASPIGQTSVPMLVRFRDPADPKSIERIDPDELSASFGAGVRLKRITVEITRDRVTSGIALRLPWVPGHSGSLDYTGLGLHPSEPEKDLTKSAFIQRVR